MRAHPDKVWLPLLKEVYRFCTFFRLPYLETRLMQQGAQKQTFFKIVLDNQDTPGWLASCQAQDLWLGGSGIHQLGGVGILPS